MTYDRTTEVVQINWIAPSVVTSGLAVCGLPGRKDRGRGLDADIKHIVAAGISTVACLIGREELSYYGVPDLLERYAHAGLKTEWFPMPDFGAPEPTEFADLVARIMGHLSAGRKVLIHCVGGLGRAGLTAACVLKHHGISGTDAIRQVRRDRSPLAVENEIQARFVEEYRP
jgi:protein-tyrosine phosphatase